MPPVVKKIRLTWRAEPRTEKAELRAQRVEPRITEDYFQALKPNAVFLTGFQNRMGLESNFFYLSFYPFLNGNVYSLSYIYPTLVFWEQITFFLNFTGLQMKRIIFQDELHLI